MPSPALLLIQAVVVLWVGFDASKRDWSDHRFANSTTKWVLGTLLLWIVALPVYLVHRRRVPLAS